MFKHITSNNKLICGNVAFSYTNKTEQQNPERISNTLNCSYEWIYVKLFHQGFSDRDNSGEKKQRLPYGWELVMVVNFGVEPCILGTSILRFRVCMLPETIIPKLVFPHCVSTLSS